MSSAEEKELKAGHPPAEKVAGMRITRQHRNSGSDKTEMTPEEVEEFGPSSPPKGEKHQQSVLISGANTKEDKAFPADAVRTFHDKPMPTKEKRPVGTQHHINQPR